LLWILSKGVRKYIACRRSEAGALAACEHMRHGERRLRKIVEERRRPAEPAQPPAEKRAKTPNDGDAGAFAGSGPMAERS
jgi:hypothetical protein